MFPTILKCVIFPENMGHLKIFAMTYSVYVELPFISENYFYYNLYSCPNGTNMFVADLYSTEWAANVTSKIEALQYIHSERIKNNLLSIQPITIPMCGEFAIEYHCCQAPKEVCFDDQLTQRMIDYCRGWRDSTDADKQFLCSYTLAIHDSSVSTSRVQRNPFIIVAGFGSLLVYGSIYIAYYLWRTNRIENPNLNPLSFDPKSTHVIFMNIINIIWPTIRDLGSIA